MPAPLSLAHMAAITAAVTGDRPPKASILARQLGLEPNTVWKAMNRIQEAGGWYTPLTWGVCAHCGQLLASPRGHLRRTHPQCVIAHKYHQLKVRQAGLPPDVAASRLDRKRACGRKAEHKRWTRLSPAAKAHELASFAEALRSARAETAAVATRRHAPWTPEEDRYIIDHAGFSIRQLALDLSRTYSGVDMRRAYLHKAALVSLPVRRRLYPAGTAPDREEAPR